MRGLLFLLFPITVIASEISLDDQLLKKRVDKLNSSELRELILFAKLSYRGILKEHPDFSPAKSGLSLCCDLLGNCSRTEVQWKELLEQSPNNPDVQKALEPSEHFTLNAERIAELNDKYCLDQER